ncbi:MAG: AgmX/PglI C-terminal domain-containing protein [Deltaproteobacteria bacterium]|nr:AgmX/PglI C-terminal domain-containing protein [Deltaproteobacteria bacterium]
MEGIRAAVRAELGPGGQVQRCYRKYLAAQPREGKVLVRFSLTPEGRATGFQVVQDELGSKDMSGCLLEVLAGVEFPAPGEVPCQVVYPFSFFPKGR